jgi:hypothetical protein
VRARQQIARESTAAQSSRRGARDDGHDLSSHLSVTSTGSIQEGGGRRSPLAPLEPISAIGR